MKTPALALTAALLLAACGAELPQDAAAKDGQERPSQTLAKGQAMPEPEGAAWSLKAATLASLPDCTPETEGRLAWVSSEKTAFACDGSIWAALDLRGAKGAQGEKGDAGVSIAGRDGKDGVDGKDGAAGKDGDSCSVTEDSSGARIRCGATEVLVANGRDGRDGIDGQDGEDGLNGQDGLNGSNATGPTLTSRKWFRVTTRGLAWQFNMLPYISDVFVETFSDGSQCIFGSGLAPRDSMDQSRVTYPMARICGAEGIKGTIAYKWQTAASLSQGNRFAFVGGSLKVYDFQGTTNTLHTPHEILDHSSLL